MRPVLRSKAKNEKFGRPKPANVVATKAPERLEKAPTGITGLDEVTFGGLPRGRATLITGSPGCGKTMLGVAFLVNGARMYSEPGVCVAFEDKRRAGRKRRFARIRPRQTGPRGDARD